MELLYNKINNDKHLLDIYKKIDDLNNEPWMWTKHGYSHVMNVVKNTEQIMQKLNYDARLIELAKIAAFMHDIGCIYGKEKHADHSYEMVKQYFEDNNINTKDNKMILMAIKHHSNARKLNNQIAKILRFSDKLDITKDRLTKVGYSIKGMKEYQYIDKINIDIEEKLIISFIVNKKINKADLENFYFTKKVSKAIHDFAKEINKPYEILYNGKNWENIYVKSI